MQSHRNREPRITVAEAYTAIPEYRAYLDRMQAATRPVRDHVAALMAAGLTPEQAWVETLKRVRP